MKTLAVLMFVLAGIAQDIYSVPIKNGKACPNCFTGPTGPTLPPIGECAEADTCAVFGGWRVGRFRVSSDHSQFVQCTGDEHFKCMRCGPNNSPKNANDNYLVYSERCDACVRRGSGEEGTCQPRTTEAPGTPIPTVPYNQNFCKDPPRNGEEMGNFEDSVNTNWYYSCVGFVTYHMPCAIKGQFYNATCDACMMPMDHN